MLPMLGLITKPKLHGNKTSPSIYITVHGPLHLPLGKFHATHLGSICEWLDEVKC